jgi:small redox-active disulfide protein 2
VNCRTLEKRAQEAVKQLSIDAKVEKIEDIKGIMSYGVLSTPGLVIDEKVVVQGRVPTVEALKEIISKVQTKSSEA